MDILFHIREALHQRYDIPLEEITPETTLQSLGIDSLGLIELMFEVEDQLKIRIPQDFATPVTIADLVELVDRVLKSTQKDAA